MKINILKDLYSSTPKMPLLFVGHGSPMNAIEENVFVKEFTKISKEIPSPNAIICISAHWETKGTHLTAMEKPRTIHDFGGFPKELFEVQYPVAGSPILAQKTKDLITNTEVNLDYNWGLDHGTWSVMKHFYPEANIPIIQMSLDYSKPPEYHYQLASELSALRDRGVLIVGSGNLIHNLRKVAWDQLNNIGFGYDWAIEAKEKMESYLRGGNHNALVKYHEQGEAFKLAIPTPEHYLPMLYILGLKEKNEEIQLFNNQLLAGSLDMTSFKIDSN